jgi:hypothetical protein
MRVVLAIFTLLASVISACAQFVPCPSITIGWASQGPPPVTSVLYSQQDQVLYVIFNYTQASAFSGVPTSIMQTFSQSNNFYQTYQNLVLPSYHALLLQEKNNCPLFFEPNTGKYIWTD